MTPTPQIPPLEGMTPLGLPETLRSIATEEERTYLRGKRPLPSIMKSTIYSRVMAGHAPLITMQLGQDVYVYGVWEALLYVESYERTAPENGGPAYLPGTAVAALKAWRAGRAKAKKIVGTE